MLTCFLRKLRRMPARLRDIGAPGERIQVSGNLKFDVALPAAPAIVASLRSTFQQAGAGPVVVCGSTVDEEEGLLLRAFENVLASHPRAVMILAPRRPERFGEVAKLLEQLNLRFWRRSLWNGDPVVGGVFLVDTIGELSFLYALADVAFVGGSLVPARRPQYHRARPARRAYHNWQPHRELSRYRWAFSESRRGARGGPGGIPPGLDGASF